MITVDQAIHRARNHAEAVVAASVRRFQTQALLAGADPDDLDTAIAVYQAEASRALEAHLVDLRAAMVAELRGAVPSQTETEAIR